MLCRLERFARDEAKDREVKALDEDTFVRLPGEGGMPVTNRDIAEQFGLGIGQARRGWLEAGDVANTRSLFALRKLIRRN